MDAKDVIEGLLRWIHVIAGIAWIGLLYFFNWVNAHFAATLDGETKKKVVPELMPRALYWFRWGAAFTWVTGVLLAMLVYYHGSQLLWAGAVLPDERWGAPTIVLVALTFLAVFEYDMLFKKIKDQRVAAAIGLVLVGAILAAMEYWAKWSFRGALIHVAAMFGTIMAFNVWFRIWPAQKKIITAVKAGQAPDPAVVSLAGTRSKHNTYMSVPLVFGMLGQHQTWAGTGHPWTFLVIVAVGWALVFHLYKISKSVKGF